MRFGLLMALALLLISGCATQQQSEFERTHTGAQIIQLYKQRGDVALCTQPGYQKCIGLSEKACVKSASTYKHKCIKEGDEAAAKQNSDRAKRSAFGRAYGKCMATHELAKHPDDMTKVATCFKNMQFDRKLFEDTLIH